MWNVKKVNKETKKEYVNNFPGSKDINFRPTQIFNFFKQIKFLLKKVKVKQHPFKNLFNFKGNLIDAF